MNTCVPGVPNVGIYIFSTHLQLSNGKGLPCSKIEDSSSVASIRLLDRSTMFVTVITAA